MDDPLVVRKLGKSSAAGGFGPAGSKETSDPLSTRTFGVDYAEYLALVVASGHDRYCRMLAAFPDIFAAKVHRPRHRHAVGPKQRLSRQQQSTKWAEFTEVGGVVVHRSENMLLWSLLRCFLFRSE